MVEAQVVGLMKMPVGFVNMCKLFMEGADPHSAKRLHHNLEVVETEIDLLCEALKASESVSA